MKNPHLVQAGAVLMFVGVGLGAFGAHALKDVLTPEHKETWKTAVQYQLVHGAALLYIGRLAADRMTNIIGWLFVVGTILFSGSLFLLAITGKNALGAITPLGGLCFLSGWALLAYSVNRHKATA